MALFPVTPEALKSADGIEATNPDNLICRAVRAVKAALPELGVICDVALDPYTTHGHDGLLDERGAVANDTDARRPDPPGAGAGRGRLRRDRARPT